MPPDMANLIKNMNHADKTLNYVGVFVYMDMHFQVDEPSNSLHSHTLRVVHKIKDGEAYERLVSLEGRRRESVRGPWGSDEYFQQERRARMTWQSQSIVRPDSVAISRKNVPSMSRYYRYAIRGDDRVADRAVWIVDIIPKETDRYGHTLWIDKEYYLLLKSELWDSGKNVLERVMFVDVRFLSEIDDEMLLPESATEDYRWERIGAGCSYDEVETSGWQFGWLPVGFEVHDYLSRCRESNGEMEHWIVSDGLAVFSVFFVRQEATDGEKRKFMHEAHKDALFMGPINLFSTMIDDYHVTVVGKLPLATLQGVGKSIVHLP